MCMSLCVDRPPHAPFPPRYSFMLEYIREAGLAEVQLVPYFQDMLYEALDMSNSMEGPSSVRIRISGTNKRQGMAQMLI